MATVNITGTIQDASENGVENVVIRLSPAPASVAAAQAIGGVGVLSDPVEILTSSTGTFTLPAIIGFRYRLEIPAVSFDREFEAPNQATIRFDLLGLLPQVETVARGYVREDADGDGYSDVGGTDELVTFVTVKCSPIATVLERYDSVVLERAASTSGSWTTIATSELLPNVTFYKVTDTTATTADIIYRARYTKGADASQYSPVVSSETEHEESLILTIDELKENYLFGADLTRDDGTPFPDRMFRHYIQAGADWLSKELDIPLTPETITEEVHDHMARDYARWGYFQLRRYPVIAVDTVKFQYPSMNQSVVINPKWVVNTEGGSSGVIQIVPGQGGIADVLLIPGALMPLWSGRTGRVPGIWRFSYRAGFETGSCPPDIKHVVGMWASIGILNIAGDLIAGAGIATKSVSIPGLSQNISTTASATNSGYGARIIEYQKEIKEMLPNLRRFYGKATRMVVV